MNRDLILSPSATNRDWALDVALVAVVMALQAISPVVFGRAYSAGEGLAALITYALPLTLLVRRHAPLICLTLATLVGLANLAVLNHPTVALVTVPLVAYAVARWIPTKASRSVLVVGALASVAGPYRWFIDDRGYLPAGADGVLPFAFFCLCFGAVVTPYILGRRSLETDRARVAALEMERERYAAAAEKEAQRARIAEASARTEIARELHDVVAHSLSVMIVQAEGGRAIARKNPDAAAEALDTIAHVGRESLTEMRRIVGVLRGDEPVPAEFAPAPTLDDIPALVARLGDRADLVVTGTPTGTTPALELTAYRVVQEALTNMLKHAGPDATAHVRLTYSATALDVTVTDDGRGFDPDSDPGKGILGMRERVTSMNGTLEAGPASDHGFRVHAVLPIRGQQNS